MLNNHWSNLETYKQFVEATLVASLIAHVVLHQSISFLHEQVAIWCYKVGKNYKKLIENMITKGWGHWILRSFEDNHIIPLFTLSNQEHYVEQGVWNDDVVPWNKDYYIVEVLVTWILVEGLRTNVRYDFVIFLLIVLKLTFSGWTSLRIGEEYMDHQCLNVAFELYTKYNEGLSNNCIY